VVTSEAWAGAAWWPNSATGTNPAGAEKSRPTAARHRPVPAPAPAATELASVEQSTRENQQLRTDNGPQTFNEPVPLSATPEDRVLAGLVRQVFQEMQLANEAGSLLKIEEEIATVVAEAKKAAMAGPWREQRQLFEVRPPQPKQKRLDFEIFEIRTKPFGTKRRSESTRPWKPTSKRRTWHRFTTAFVRPRRR